MEYQFENRNESDENAMVNAPRTYNQAGFIIDSS